MQAGFPVKSTLTCKSCGVAFLAPAVMTQAAVMERSSTLGPTQATCSSCGHSGLSSVEELTEE